jgi:uncharacterized protein DUF2752
MSLTWRPPVRSDHQVAALWAVCATGCVALRPVWFAVAVLLPPCAWHRWTGLPCPGCGTRRAILRLLHGDVVAGFALNPLAAAGASAFVVAGWAAPVWLLAGGGVPVVDSKGRPSWLAAAAVALLANWVWLYVSGV